MKAFKASLFGFGALMALTMMSCDPKTAPVELTASGLNPAKFDTVVNGDGGTKEVLVILADKVTGGGVAPMIVVLDITSESPVAVMSEPVMIDMTHYDKNATATKDGDTVIYNVSKFDDTIRTYCQTTDKGLKLDGKLFIIEGGKLVEGIR